MLDLSQLRVGDRVHWSSPSSASSDIDGTVFRVFGNNVVVKWDGVGFGCFDSRFANLCVSLLIGETLVARSERLSVGCAGVRR